MGSADFEVVVKEYHPIIYKICRVYTDATDFHDLYQEVLINIWKSFDNFQGKSKRSTWLYRVALNTALTYTKKESKHKGNTSDFELPDIPEAENDSLEKERQIEKLYLAIGQLKKDDRILILLYLEEKPYGEIAEVTGLTQSNVGVKINRIKKKLFELLSGQENG